jgi:hypothetical protein
MTVAENIYWVLANIYDDFCLGNERKYSYSNVIDVGDIYFPCCLLIIL